MSPASSFLISSVLLARHHLVPVPIYVVQKGGKWIEQSHCQLTATPFSLVNSIVLNRLQSYCGEETYISS